MGTETLVIANGDTRVISLGSHSYAVVVDFTDATGGTLTFKRSATRDGNFVTIVTPTPDESTKEATTTASKAFKMYGGGFLIVSATDVVGTLTLSLIGIQ